MSESLLRDKAEEATRVMVKSQGVDKAKAMDPLMMVAVLQALIELIKLWKSCKTNPEQAVDKIKKPGIVGKLAMRRIIRRVGKQRFSGREDLREHLAEMELAIHKVGINTTPEEMKRIFDEVG